MWKLPRSHCAEYCPQTILDLERFYQPTFTLQLVYLPTILVLSFEILNPSLTSTRSQNLIPWLTVTFFSFIAFQTEGIFSPIKKMSLGSFVCTSEAQWCRIMSSKKLSHPRRIWNISRLCDFCERKGDKCICMSIAKGHWIHWVSMRHWDSNSSNYCKAVFLHLPSNKLFVFVTTVEVTWHLSVSIHNLTHHSVSCQVSSQAIGQSSIIRSREKITLERLHLTFPLLSFCCNSIYFVGGRLISQACH